MGDAPASGPALTLSMVPARPHQRWFAASVALASILIFLAIAPFARIPLASMGAFIPAYESATALNHLITAALLYGQFSITRSRALMLLAGGYLFSALMAVFHGLTFPGLFSPTGLLGAGPQTTAWLFMFWHGGFPITIIGYSLLKSERSGHTRIDTKASVAGSAIAAFVIAALLTLLATAGEDALPAIMQGNHYAPSMSFVVATVWFLNLLGLAAILAHRPFSVLDLWLMVVLCGWLCDIALSAVLNAGRFDLGFYAGRIYGLLAGSFVLIVLLVETIALYAQSARLIDIERRDRERRLSELHSELIHVSRLSELGQMVSALAHEVNQPLTAIGNYVRAAQRLLRAGNEAMLRTALAKAADEATRAGEIVKRLRDFTRKADSRQRAEDLTSVLEEAVALALMAADRPVVAVELRVRAEASVALIDKIQVQQILLNLIRNAIEAMDGLADPALLIGTKLVSDTMLEISVADIGPGLSGSVREKLFQPFVTTKSEGMGVGLSICRSIVEAHGGRIWADDNAGGGTVFRFTVPRAEAYAEEQRASVPA